MVYFDGTLFFGPEEIYIDKAIKKLSYADL